MRVLLAVDGSACSEAAVQMVADRFRPEGVHVKVVHAVEWMHDMPLCFQYAQGPTAAENVTEYRNRSFARARGMLARIASRLEFKGFRTSVLTPEADPRHAIVDIARDWPADLIVMGSHGRRGFDRLLLGSVAEAVVRHAACSVEIVRVPAADALHAPQESRHDTLTECENR